MQASKSEKLRPIKLLYDVRKSVSEILDKPFTERIDHQIFKPDQKSLAAWAGECAERVLPYFEEKYPDDCRPRRAIEVLREWLCTGIFDMAGIRKASLGAHASAKGKKEEDTIFAAHAAGQAVGAAHVVTHSLGASIYGIRAVAAHFGNVNDGLKERDWQLERLREYVKQNEEHESASMAKNKKHATCSSNMEAPRYWTIEGLFEGYLHSYQLFKKVRGFIESLGTVKTKAHKTQVSFSTKTGFAWVWLPQKWIRKTPENSIVISFGLGRRVVHPHIKESTEPYPSRWTHHVVIEKESEFDDNVRAWLREAFEFSQSRNRKGK